MRRNDWIRDRELARALRRLDPPTPTPAQLASLARRIVARATPLLDPRRRAASSWWEYAAAWAGTLLPLGVAAALSTDAQVWAAVHALAETFLTPRRLQKVMGLLPTVDQQPESFAAATRRRGMAPVLLKQHLRTVLLLFFARPTEVSLAWVPQLVDHPVMVEPVDALLELGVQ